MAVRPPLVSVLLRRDGPLPLSAAATAALCAPGLGTASSRAASATAAILLLPRRLAGGWEAPAQTPLGPPSLLPPATQLLLTEKEEKRVARERRTEEGREERRALPGNRRRAAPAKEGLGAVWDTEAGVPGRGRGGPALAPEGREAARLQGAPGRVCLGRAR